MARTGYKIIVYLDDNPLSPTYMETYEEKVLDETTCPIEGDDLVLISNECEVDLSGYTGYRLEIYYNRTTGEYVENRVEDPECVESSTDEQWVNSGSPYCETTDKGINTGYMLQLQVQMNPNLANYGKTRTQRYKSPECGGNNCPIWDDLQDTCHIAVNDCVATFDGTSDIMQIDINPLSETFNQTRTVNKEDSDCENCTETTFSWVVVGDMCGDDDLLCSNGIQQTSTNSYTVSQKYKTIGSSQPVPMDEYQVVLKTVDDEDCGYIRPQYRWDVVVGQYLCDTETYTKYEMLVKMVSYDAGQTWATKQPVETERGNVLAYDSYDCGKPMYRWLETDEFVCEDIGDDWKIASVDSSGNVISSVTCSNSLLTQDDVQSIAKSGNTYMIGNCVNEISAYTFQDHSTKAYGTKIISMGDYVETIGECGLTYVGLGYYEDTEYNYDIPHPLVLSRNLKYLGNTAFSDNYYGSGNKLVQFTTEEPPTHTGNTSGQYAVVNYFNMCIVPFGSLTKYKNCSWLSANTTTINNYLFQEPWTAATDNYKLAIEMSGVTFYLADDYTETLTNFDTRSLCRTINYYFKSIRDPNAGTMYYDNSTSYVGLKAWIGRNVKTLESDAFPQSPKSDGVTSSAPKLWFTDIYIQSDEPPMVYDNTFRYLTHGGETTRINVLCESYPLYFEDANWTKYQTFIVPTDTSCVTDYEWVEESEICDTASGKYRTMMRKYIEISGNTYPTGEIEYVQTDRDCVSITLDGGWAKADCSELCYMIGVKGYSCAGAYYGRYETTALINVDGIRHFEFYCAQNGYGGCGSAGSKYGTIKIYNVDDVQMTGSTYYTTQSWTASKVTFDLDGGNHVIPILYTNDTAGSSNVAVGSIYLRDEYTNLVPSYVDNLPSGWSKSQTTYGMTYTASYNTNEDLIITVTNCSSVRFRLSSQYQGQYSNYFELFDVDSSSEVVATTPRHKNTAYDYGESYYTISDIPSGTHTIRVRNVIGNSGYANTSRTISIVSYN